MFGEDSSRNRQRDSRSEAFEQTSVQLLLELSDLRANGRLSSVAGLGCLRETLQPHNLEERMKLIKIHGLASFWSFSRDELRSNCSNSPKKTLMSLRKSFYEGETGPPYRSTLLLAGNSKVPGGIS